MGVSYATFSLGVPLRIYRGYIQGLASIILNTRSWFCPRVIQCILWMNQRFCCYSHEAYGETRDMNFLERNQSERRHNAKISSVRQTPPIATYEELADAAAPTRLTHQLHAGNLAAIFLRTLSVSREPQGGHHREPKPKEKGARAGKERLDATEETNVVNLGREGLRGSLNVGSLRPRTS